MCEDPKRGYTSEQITINKDSVHPDPIDEAVQVVEIAVFEAEDLQEIFIPSFRQFPIDG